MRPFFLLGALVLASPAAGAIQQAGGWTIETRADAKSPAAFKVIATRTIGPSSLVYERSILDGEFYKVTQDGCESSNSGGPGEETAAERLLRIKTAMADLVRDKDNFCKLPKEALAGLLTGIDAAIPAADAAFARDLPKIVVAPRTKMLDGWTIGDRPGAAVDGLAANHLLTMRKVSGPFSLTYTLDLSLDSGKVADGNRTVEGKYKACDYSDSDSTNYVIAANRARAFREAVAVNFASYVSGCDSEPAAIENFLAGFDAAYILLDGWAAERIDERTMLREGARADGNAGSAIDAARAARDAAMAK